MFLPDGFKPDVQKFFASPAGQAFMLALSQRIPKVVDGSTPQPHTLLDSYAKQGGYTACMDDIRKIPFESPVDNSPSEAEKTLLSTQD